MKESRELIEYVIDVVIYVFLVAVLALGVLYIMAAFAQPSAPNPGILILY